MCKKLGVLCIAVFLPASLLADFSYQETTKMTGGAMMGAMRVASVFSKQLREPTQATVAIKGNRMLHSTKDRASVIDLDGETITTIDFQKKTYSVMTFAEMAQAMEQAMQQMKDKKAEAKADGKADVKTDLKMSVKATGATKQIAGYETKEMLMTMQMDTTDQKSGTKGGMIINTSIWVAPKVAGYDEVREFYKKMGAKMTWTPAASNLMAANPDMARGMADVSRESAKLDGMHLLQVVKMTPTSDGKPVMAEGQTSSQESKPKQEAPSLTGALGKLGGFGGLGRKKKQEEPKQETAAPASSAPEEVVLMEMTTEMSGFSSASLDASKFSAPSGFKKVESDLQKRNK